MATVVQGNGGGRRDLIDRVVDTTSVSEAVGVRLNRGAADMN